MKVSKVEFDNSDLEEQQPVMAVKSELVFLDHFNRIINERDDDIDIGQLGYENYQALKLAALDAFRATMLQGAENAESTTTMQTAPALDSSPKIADSTSGNSTVIPDGWVACSERMPEKFKAILAFNKYGEVWSGAYDRYWNFYCDNLLVEHVTHWMPLPVAPQQEVK